MSTPGVPLEIVKSRARKGISADLMSSLVVFLIALPLCMGISIASGRPAAAGILTGIIGGILVGALSGCPLQVSGPAAGLTVIVYELNRAQGPAGLAVVVTLAGLMQLLAGGFRSGQLFRAVPPAVIHGMMAGIGVLIFASQFHLMVDDTPKGSGLMNLISIPGAVVKGLVPLDGSSHHLAAQLGVLTLVTLIGWTMWAPKRLKIIPAQLVAVVTATVVAFVWQMKVQYVGVPESLLGAIEPVPSSAWALLQKPAIWAEALGVAVVASAETLLAAGAADQMHDGPRTKYDKELLAQGVGNTICGLIGALPMTGVIVRSKANIDAGAQSRASSIFHGLWLLLAVVMLPTVLRMVPIASLAGLLVYTGFKLVNPSHMRELARHAKAELAIYAATLVTIVCGDLLKGVMVGVALSAVKLLWTLARLGVRSEHAHGRSVVRLEGVATFLLLPKLAQSLEAVPSGATLEVDATQLDYIDHACIELMHSWAKRHESTGGRVTADWAELRSLSTEMRRTTPLAPAVAQ